MSSERLREKKVKGRSHVSPLIALLTQINTTSRQKPSKGTYHATQCREKKVRGDTISMLEIRAVFLLATPNTGGKPVEEVVATVSGDENAVEPPGLSGYVQQPHKRVSLSSRSRGSHRPPYKMVEYFVFYLMNLRCLSVDTILFSSL